MKVHTNIRMDSELLKILKAGAKKQRRSFTNFVEVALWDYINADKESKELKADWEMIKKLKGK